MECFVCITVPTQGGVGGGEAGGGVGGAVGRGGRHQPSVHRVLRGQGILQRRQEKSRNLCDLQQNPLTEWSVFYSEPSPDTFHYPLACLHFWLRYRNNGGGKVRADREEDTAERDLDHGFCWQFLRLSSHSSSTRLHIIIRYRVSGENKKVFKSLIL